MCIQSGEQGTLCECACQANNPRQNSSEGIGINIYVSLPSQIKQKRRDNTNSFSRFIENMAQPRDKQKTCHLSFYPRVPRKTRVYKAADWEPRESCLCILYALARFLIPTFRNDLPSVCEEGPPL